MTVFAFTPVLAELFFAGTAISLLGAAGSNFAAFRPRSKSREISQWFLFALAAAAARLRRNWCGLRASLLWLRCAAGFCDGILFLFYPSVLSDRGCPDNRCCFHGSFCWLRR